MTGLIYDWVGKYVGAELYLSRSIQAKIRLFKILVEGQMQ